MTPFVEGFRVQGITNAELEQRYKALDRKYPEKDFDYYEELKELDNLKIQVVPVSEEPKKL